MNTAETRERTSAERKPGTKRWWAAGAAAVAAYLLSFVPACWLLMRVDPAASPAVWRSVQVVSTPAAFAALSGPRFVRDAVVGLVKAGEPEGAAAKPGWPVGGPTREVEFLVVADGPGGSGRGFGVVRHRLTPDGRLVNDVRRVW